MWCRMERLDTSGRLSNLSVAYLKEFRPLRRIRTFDGIQTFADLIEPGSFDLCEVKYALLLKKQPVEYSGSHTRTGEMDFLGQNRKCCARPW